MNSTSRQIPILKKKWGRAHWLVVVAFALMAVFIGLVAATGELVANLVLASVLLGLGLLFRPLWIMHLILVLGLLVVGVIPLWADGLGAKSVWGVSGLGFALMLRALIQMVTTPGAAARTPVFVWLLLAFVGYTVLHSLLQWSSAGEFFSGVKRYFQVVGLVFAMAWLSIDRKTIFRWRTLVVAVAVLQLPWAFYELIKLVPLRESLRYIYPSMIPIDVVAGTFGATMYGGGANGEMATFLIIFLGFALARQREKMISVRRFFWIVPILIPLFLGETKVVLVVLPLMFITLYRKELLKRPVFSLGALATGALLTICAGYVYMTLLGKTADRLVEDTIEYNFKDRGYGTNVLNRTTALTFWIKRQGTEDPLGAVFGHGIGTAHTATGGYLARTFAGFGIDLTTASTLLWEQGPIGLVLFILIFVAAWHRAGLFVEGRYSPEIRADAAAIQAAISVMAFFMIYRVAHLESMPFQIVFYGLLGYLVWIENNAVDIGEGER